MVRNSLYGSDFKMPKFDNQGRVIKAKAGKRTLGIRDKQILYSQAKGKCKNPYCHRKDKHIEFSEMQVGHKTAYSKGGGTTMANSVCLCYACNKLQGTDSWEKFIKKQQQARGQAETKTEKKVKAKPKATATPKAKPVRSNIPSNSVLSPNFKIPEFKMPQFRI